MIKTRRAIAASSIDIIDFGREPRKMGEMCVDRRADNEIDSVIFVRGGEGWL